MHIAPENSIQITGLNGSPHLKGNTATLISWVLKGCEEAGAKVEWINLKDYNLKYCQGCHTCLRTGECAIRDDDYIKILERLISSDGIVVGSPVYADGPTALLKTLMDRFTLLNLFVGIFEKQYTHSIILDKLGHQFLDLPCPTPPTREGWLEI